MAQKTPQGHKTAGDDSFKFTVKTKTYRIPKVTEAAAAAVPGGVTQDAIMFPDDQAAQVRLALHLLGVVGVDDATTTALRSLPTGEMMTIIGSWMGESSGSSD